MVGIIVGIVVVGNIAGSMVGIIKVGSTVLKVGATVGLGVGPSSEMEHVKRGYSKRCTKTAPFGSAYH